MCNEIWKDVVGYEEIYSVSNLGRVQSHKKRKNMSTMVILTPRITTNKVRGNRYSSVALYKDKKSKNKNNQIYLICNHKACRERTYTL